MAAMNSRPENTICLKDLNIERLHADTVWRWVEPGEDYICPIPVENFLPTNSGDLLILAKFTTAGRYSTEGYVGITSEGEVYSINLMIGNKIIGFNTSHRDWVHHEV